MEREPNPHEIVGSLHCEDASSYDIRPSKARIYLFENGTHPCISIRDDETQNDRYYRIPDYVVPDAMVEYGVPYVLHETDEDFRSDVTTLVDNQGNPYKWDFCPNNTKLSVGQEANAYLMASEETGYAYEYYETLDGQTQISEESDIQLDHEKTLLMEVSDAEDLNLSFLVITTESGLEYLPASPQVVDLIKQNGWEYEKWDLRNINDSIWKIIEKVHGDWLENELVADASKLL